MCRRQLAEDEIVNNRLVSIGKRFPATPSLPPHMRDIEAEVQDPLTKSFLMVSTWAKPEPSQTLSEGSRFPDSLGDLFI
jgi:hypothetical protein